MSDVVGGQIYLRREPKLTGATVPQLAYAFSEGVPPTPAGRTPSACAGSGRTRCRAAACGSTPGATSA